jgi:hypothetical protein
VGQRLQQQLVLEARGLALRPVGHDDRSTSFFGDRAHLGRGGERGAPASVESRAVDALEQPGGISSFVPSAMAGGELAVDLQMLS